MTPLAGWQARASDRAAVAHAMRAPAERPRAATVPSAGADAWCPGGPFSRYLCRTRRPAAPTAREPRPFASLLTGWRQRATRDADAGPPRDAVVSDDLTALDGLRTSLGATLGLLVASGRCRLDENALASCALSVPALSCEALSEHLAGDPGALASGVTPECARFLRCSGGDDGGVEEGDDASVEAAAGE